MLVAVEFDGLTNGWVLVRQGEQGKLLRLQAVVPAHRLDDGARVDALVDVQRDGRDLEGRVLGLAGPLELRVQMRVVGIGHWREIDVGLWGHKASGRVVDALFVGVLVGFNRALGLPGLCSWHVVNSLHLGRYLWREATTTDYTELGVSVKGNPGYRVHAKVVSDFRWVL